MKYEWKKQEKEFYGAKKSPSLGHVHIRASTARAK